MADLKGPFIDWLVMNVLDEHKALAWQMIGTWIPLPLNLESSLTDELLQTHLPGIITRPTKLRLTTALPSQKRSYRQRKRSRDASSLYPSTQSEEN